MCELLHYVIIVLLDYLLWVEAYELDVVAKLKSRERFQQIVIKVIVPDAKQEMYVYPNSAPEQIPITQQLFEVVRIAHIKLNAKKFSKIKFKNFLNFFYQKWFSTYSSYVILKAVRNVLSNNLHISG